MYLFTLSGRGSSGPQSRNPGTLVVGMNQYLLVFKSKVPSSRLFYLVSPFGPREEEQKITRYAYQAISMGSIGRNSNRLPQYDLPPKTDPLHKLVLRQIYIEILKEDIANWQEISGHEQGLYRQ